MPGTVPMITPGSITRMTGLTDRPVFFLHLHGAPAPNLVVKGEAPGAGVGVSVKWGSKLMKNVTDNRVNMKTMTIDETKIFRLIALATFNNPNDPDMRQPRYFVTSAFAQLTWVKMPIVENLSDAGEVDAIAPRIGRLKQIVVKFRNNAVWDALGKVVAVDIFNGNCDRFQVITDPARPPLGSWTNKGNVMFVADPDEPLKAIGLDPFDPVSRRSDLRARGHYDDLKILTDPERRNAFARLCVRAVGRELMNAFGKAGMATFVIPARPGQARGSRINTDDLPDLFADHMPSFAAGIAAGADDLKNYLQARVEKYRAPSPTAIGSHRKAIPQGILDRMAFLGW